MQWGDVATWVGAAVAALFGVLSWRASRRSETAGTEAENQADRATAAAESAATSQREIAQATSRVADVAEQRVSKEERKPWRIKHHGGGEGDYHLVNTSAKAKYEITVVGEPVEWGGSGDDELKFNEIDGHATEWVDLGTHDGMEKPRVVVSWYPRRNCFGEKLTQRLAVDR